jgi:hypothetical protein
MKARIKRSKITNHKTSRSAGRWLLLLALLALTALLLPQMLRVVEAQPADSASRFSRSPVTGKFTTRLPLHRQREMIVVLKLAAEPVAVVRSRAPGKQLAAGQRVAMAQNLRVQQDGLAAKEKEHES